MKGVDMTSQAPRKQDGEIDLSAYKGLFLEEATAFLATLRSSLGRLVVDQDDAQALEDAHRAAHTLKGMASTMRYEGLVALAEKLETPFVSKSPIRPQQIEFLQARCDEFELGMERLKKGDD